MSNYIQVTLGETPRGISFNLGTLRHIKKVTGEDPMKFTVDIVDYEEFMSDLGTIIYVGLLTTCTTKKVEPDFTIEQAKVWADELDMTDAMNILKTFHQAFKVDTAPREGGSDTQPLQTADVAGSDANRPRRAEPEPVGAI